MRRTRNFYTNTVHLDQIVDCIRGGSFVVPDFQRPFVWTDDQVLQLADSVSKGYPIGQMLLWKRYGSECKSSNFGGVDFQTDTRECFVVVDGLQRLNSMAALFLTDRFSYDFEREEWGVFQSRGTKVVKARHLCRQTYDTVREIAGEGMSLYDPEIKRIVEFAESIRFYNVTSVFMEEHSSLDFVVESFIRLARGGTPVSECDIRDALASLK